MIPNLPRPFLWTEKTSMDEFLKGDPINQFFHEAYQKVTEMYSSSNSSFPNEELDIFNEVYYQLTRIYYENPVWSDYPSYTDDIKSHLGTQDGVEVVMAMIYCYVTMRRISFQPNTRKFLVRIEMRKNSDEIWSFFNHNGSLDDIQQTVSSPLKPCPVPSVEMRKIYWDWMIITQKYDLNAIKEILNLWDKDDDQMNVARLILEMLQSDSSTEHVLGDYQKAEDYLNGRINKGALKEDENTYQDPSRDLQQIDERQKEKKKKDDYDPIWGKCFKFNNPFVHNLVKEVVHEYYGDIAANLALIEIVMYEHDLLRKRFAHTAFVKALVALGLLQPEKEEKIIKNIRDKYKRLPGIHYNEWGDDFIKAKRTCIKIGEKLDEIHERWQIKTR